MDNKKGVESTCLEFEKWWSEHGVKVNVPAMENAFKEVAFKGWAAAKNILRIDLTTDKTEVK